MSLFQCENCGCIENTALTGLPAKYIPELFDWEGIEERKGRMLCCVCMPLKFRNGEKVEMAGKWHNHFERIFLEKGQWITNSKGNLENIKTGETDFRKYSLIESTKNGKRIPPIDPRSDAKH